VTFLQNVNKLEISPSYETGETAPLPSLITHSTQGELSSKNIAEMTTTVMLNALLLLDIYPDNSYSMHNA
jgi:hypothetical protein